MIMVMPICSALVLPVPVPAAVHMLPVAQVQGAAAATHTNGGASCGQVFPLELLAVGYEGEQKVYTEEDKAAARNTGLFIVAASALPSVWAQNELVWSKEKLDKARGKKKKELSGPALGSARAGCPPPAPRLAP
eukprot:CAMPEP_0119374312 /NCGR_PEP_ID=MMETSP1334-20130426/30521_1 /TAXON_ID=127549 /ORGANISM="Calcidiscus leptoporus, Strain RCC1130" /LENGTH=133 /DNA_ID=CAMNT_0007392347 /DNA_START=40 /DNA_END=439 /DNA_ORIENTATION=-